MESSTQTKKRFGDRYKTKGGVNKLLHLYQQGLSNPEIAKHFGVSDETIRLNLKKILGSQHLGWPWRKASTEIKDMLSRE